MSVSQKGAQKQAKQQLTCKKKKEKNPEKTLA